MAQQDPREPRRLKIRHIFLGLLLLLLGWFTFFRISVYLNVNKRFRELRDQGYPMSLEELGQSYSLPPGVDNAADYYLTAFSRYVEWDSEAREGLPWIGGGKLPARPEPLDASTRQQAERFLADNAKTLSLLHEAVISEHCRYPIDFAREAGAGTPWLKDVRKNAYLLCLEGLVACERGDPNQALASVQATSALARSLNAPVLMHRLVSNAVQAMAYTSAERILNRVPLSDGQLQTLSGWFESSDDGEGYRQALVGERCFGADAFRGSARQLANHVMGSAKILTLFIVPRKLLGLHDHDMLSYLNVIQDHIDLAGMPLHERLAKYGTLDTGASGPRRQGILARTLLPAFGRIFQLENRYTAHRRVARTALAVERYRLAEGRLPQALSDLVPAYLGAVPNDPFDGEDLKYRPRDAGYVVYSIGDDLSDDGGTEQGERKRNAEGKSISDVTFVVER